MSKKITKLTQEQKDRIPEWVDKWIKIGLCTDEADWDGFERGVKECYKFANIPFPNKIIRVQSPIVGALSASIADKIINNGNSSDVYSAVGSAVSSDVSSAVRSDVDSAVYSDVDSAMYSAVDSAVSSDVSSAVESAVSSSKLKWHYWFGGQFWSAWQAYITYFTDVCNWTPYGDILQRLRAYELIQKSACFWWANRHFVIVCNRPEHIHFNNRHQLHDEKDMAIKWRDGWGIYSLNGITVPSWVVTTPAEQIDPKKVLDEKNTDVQRELIRKVGYERILKACNAKSEEEWTCPKTGLKYSMKRMRLGAIDRRYLCYEHASIPGVFYAKAVPPECRTIVQMRAFQTGVFGFTPEEAREGIKNNRLTDKELLTKLPETVQ